MSEASSSEQITLRNAWRRFATFDLNANVVQKKFFRLRIQILVVGVAATALAIVYSQYIAESSVRPAYSDWRFLFWLPMISLPILGSVLAAGASKLARGVDWINLRGASEGIKREIYRYRCGVGVYSEGGGEADTGGEQLARAVGEITGRLMDTEILNASLLPYRNEQLPPKYSAADGDDGNSTMGPEQYIEWRLKDQHTYFNRKANKLDRQHRVFQWTIAILGGAGTLLAVLGQEIWVPVAVGISTALASYLAFRNVETNLAGYNRADLELDNVATWWSGLPEAKSQDPAVFAALVDRTETVLGSENAGWVQQMQDAMDKLKEEEKE